MSQVKTIGADELKAMLHDGAEIAVLDAREEGDFATSHLLFACSVPLSQLERLLALRVPRRAARVVWMDAGEGFAQAAAARSAAFGYQDVSVLEGGVEAWRMAGYQVYTGVHVPSKAFAEVIEHDEHTPWISAQALCEKAAADPNLVLLDSRSYEEYHSNTIPGARSCPGAELVYRIQDIVPSADALVVVNCGGRTRSIIGAQSLINAGLPNQVVSLRDGTMAWHLTGMEVAIGRQEKPPATSSAGLQWAQEATERVAKRFAVERIDAEVLGRWLVDTERTLYVIDVRTVEEYQAGHIESARWVGGGQLVQETDQHIGVWGARVVLTDDDAVRATMTASWLKQMGWEAYVFVPGAEHPRIAGMPSTTTLSVQHTTPPSITAAQLASALEGADAPLVVDIGTSVDYANEHIAGAWFATRARLELGVTTLPEADTLVVTSADGELASLTVTQLLAQGRSASALAGGTQAWVAARLPLENGMTRPACPANDLWHTPRGRDPQRREAAMREYLTWETALVFQIKQDDDCRFQSFPA
ncbi:MAG: rhodanese-related sulfurtransferase [Gammaproteobacteria bacterium]|jgi:rhodanese-related sulfurtransferase